MARPVRPWAVAERVVHERGCPMVNRWWVFLLVVAFVVALAPASPAFAADAPNAWTKLGRGFVNLTTGWLELPVQTVKGATGESPVVGTFYGFGEGILRGIQRTGLGLVDGLTFPYGPYDKPVMEPHTVFGNIS